jgi:hypothetical protein
MKTETITILRPCDFEKLETFINYFLFGKSELPKKNPYNEYILSDSLLEFLANYSEEIKIVTGAENLYLVKVFNLFLRNSEVCDREDLSECYDSSFMKTKISYYIELITKQINTNLDIFTPQNQQSTHEAFVKDGKINLEILTFIVHQLSGILSYVPERSCSISARQYERIIDNYVIDHHRRSSIINAFRDASNDNH